MRTLVSLLVVASSAHSAAAAEPSANTCWHAEWLTAHDDIALTSLGVVRLDTDEGASLDAFHVQVTLSPHARVAGDLTTAVLALPGRTALPAIAANADATVPALIVEPGRNETVELYFPVPTGASAVFTWKLTTPHGPVTLRARLRPDAAAAQGDTELGEARHWWFSHVYAWPAFRHSDGVITSRPPKSAVVRRVA
jgi:hypothetical protein